jgi:hypothetical protein
MELDTLIDRAIQIRDSLPLPNVKQRMAQAAQELSLAGTNQARVELLNESVLALTKVLYDADPDGLLANVDRATYRILIPVPWGRAGWKRWGLRYWESEILRKILIVRCQMQRVQPLYDYNDESRTWHINLSTYGRLDAALTHWKGNAITLREWRTFADVYRRQAHERMQQNRLAR